MKPTVIIVLAQVWLHLIIIFTLNLISACSPQLSSPLTIIVQDQHNQPIHQAIIDINGNNLGLTNAEGRLTTTISLKANHRLNLKISAHSPDLHIAPYNKGITKNDIINNQIIINATLYTLRKPDPNSQLTAQALSHTHPLQVFTDHPAKVADISNREDEEGEEAKQNTDTNNHEPKIQPQSAETAADAVPSAQGALQHSLEDPPAQAAPPPRATQTTPVNSAQLHPPQPTPSPLSPLQLNLNKLHQLANQPTFKSRKPGDLQISVLDSPLNATTAPPQPLSGVRVYLGFQNSIHLFCETSSHGHCLMNPAERLGRVVTLILQKPGYTTQSFKIQLNHNENHTFTLTRGGSIDIVALSSHYGAALGIADVEVRHQGTSLGRTNSFGYFTIPRIKLPHRTPTTLTLHHNQLIPAARTISINGPATTPVVAPFSYKSPAPARVLLSAPELLQRQKHHTPPVTTTINSLYKSLRNQVFRAQLIRRIGYAIAQSATSAQFSLQTATRHGWQHKELSTWLDVLITQYIYPQSRGWRSTGHLPALLETRIHESAQGLIQSIVTPMTLPFFDDDHLTSETLGDQIRTSLPYQGTILAIDDDVYTLNLGTRHRPDHTQQSFAQVYRINPSPATTTLITQIPIAELLIKSVAESTSTAHVYKASAAESIQVGDLVVIYPQSRLKPVHTDLMIMDYRSTMPLAQVNLYLNHTQVGHTNADGYVMVNQQYLNTPNNYTLMLPGYEIKHLNLTLKRSQSLPAQTLPHIPGRTVMLRRLHNVIKIDSQPTGLNTYIHNKLVGSTPISLVQPPTSSIQISLSPPQNYKPITRLIDAPSPFLDLTGPQTIRLEKDFLAKYQSLLGQNKLKQAAKILELIPAHHSDYSAALEIQARHSHQHQLHGHSLLRSYQLLSYLKKTQQPPTPSQTRWLMSAGIHSFKLASQFDQQKDFSQSNALYSRTMEFLQFSHHHLNPEKHTDPVSLRALDYHLTLAIHRKALIKHDKQLLKIASGRWNDYLQSHPPSPPDPFLSQATIYANQAKDELKRF